MPNSHIPLNDVALLTIDERIDRDNERHQRISERQDERYREIGELRFSAEDEE